MTSTATVFWYRGVWSNRSRALSFVLLLLLGVTAYADDKRSSTSKIAVDAGGDQMLWLPENSVILTGTGSASGGGPLSYLWSVEQADGPVDTGNTGAAELKVSNLAEGVYRFRLTVSRGSHSAWDEATVTVSALTVSVSVGPDQALELPRRDTVLTGRGSASDGGEVQYLWEHVEGLSSTLSGINAPEIYVSNLSNGAHRFQLTISRNGVSESADVRVKVVDGELSHLWGGPLSEARKAELDRAVLDSPKQPYEGHPRLYGSNAEWTERMRVLDELDPGCTFGGQFSGVGTVKNVKAIWERESQGGVRCDGTVPTTPAEHRHAGAYVNGTLNTAVRGHFEDRLRVLHLIRRELYCHEQNPSDESACQFTAEDTQALAEGYINGETARLRNAPRSARTPDWADEIGYPPGFTFITWWHKTSDLRFDLGSAPEFKAWTLFLDTFWDHPSLSDADRLFVETELEYEIDSYLMSAEKNYWNLANGNNWTVVLNSAALYWAILYYYEKPEKARQVLETVLSYNWLHRDYYTDEGAYFEGPSYVETSYSPQRNMHHLLRTSFGEILHSFNWFAAGAAMPAWLNDNVAPDGTMVDFGDAWPKRGHITTIPLELMLHREMIGLDAHATTAPDACETHSYFMNSYHAAGFSDVWAIDPSLARDWHSIASSCSDPAGEAEALSLYVDYGLGVVRSDYPGASAAADRATDDVPYTLQADQTMLAVNGVRNDISHREADFGALIWTAFGNRLLFDFGYGGIVRNSFEYDIFHRVGGGFSNQIDYMLAATKLIVPSAFTTQDGAWERPLYLAEPYGLAGTISRERIDGVDVVLADGTALYSGSSPAHNHRPSVEGPLEYFHRWLVPIEAGNFLVVDAFKAKPGKASKIQEFWLTEDDDINSGCGLPLATSSEDVEVSREDETTVVLSPVCAQVPAGERSETVGRIKGAALHRGTFQFGIPDFLPGDPDFRADALDTRNGVAILQMTNRVGKRDRKKLFRWVPDNDVSEDVRVFLLQAATEKLGGLAPAQVEQVTDGCADEHLCFSVTVGNLTQRQITLSRQSGRYRLVALE